MADRADPATPPGMAARVAAFDWAATPLGPRGAWPPELAAAVDLVLASPYLATLAVGGERTLIYNDVAAASYGDAHPGALGRPIGETWPDAWAKAGRHYDRVFAGEAVHVPAQPLDLKRPGAGQVFDAYLTPVRDADGRVVAAHMAGFEVGARLRAEAALAESEAKYRTLFQSMDEAYAVVEAMRGPDGRWSDFLFLEVNEAFGPHTGMPDPVGRTASDLLGAPDPRWAEIYGRVAETGEPARFEQDEPTLGRVFDLNVFRLGGAGSRRVAVLFTDVTERKRAERTLRESEERFRTLADVAPQLVWSGVGSGADFYNRGWLDYTGLSLEESCRPDAWRRVVHPDDLPEAVRRSERSGGTGEPYEVEYRLRRADGAYRWHIARAVRTPGGDRWVGAATDIHDGRAALEAAEASERRLKVLMEGVPQLVWRAAANGLWTWASPQWADVTGQSTENSLGYGWLERVHPDDRAGVDQAWHDALARGEYKVDHRLRDVRDGEGSHRWHHSRALPLRDEAGEIVEWLGTSTDIDELRRLQERQTVLVEELQHRTRNLVAMVRSVADRTMRGAGDLIGFERAFLDRLDAMGRAQGLLSRLDEGDRVLWDELLRSELDALRAGEDKVTLDGPAGVRLRSGAVQLIALGVHELATNAVKYGALGQPGARLHVGWTVEPDARGRTRLHVRWTESGVAMPPPGAVRGGGQGRELIERALPYQLGARTRLEMGPDGVRCELWLPVSER